jgi:uncharacterized membrane protein YGL010W
MQPRLEHQSRFYHEGRTLLHELKFIHHYHRDRRNQILHLITTWLALTLILLLLLIIIGPEPTILLPLLYIGYFIFLDPYAGAIWTLLFSISLSIDFACWYFIRIDYRLCWTELSSFICALVIIVSLSMQGFGHLVFEHSLPAFRLFEFAVTTPFFLAYCAVWNLLGHDRFRSDLWQSLQAVDVKERAQDADDSKQHGQSV